MVRQLSTIKVPAIDIPKHERKLYRQQWVRLPAVACFDRRLTRGAWRTLAALALHADQAGQTYVSQRTLGECMRVSGQYVGTQIKLLVELGYIKVIGKRGRGKRLELQWRIAGKFPSPEQSQFDALRMRLDDARETLGHKAIGG